MSTYKKAPEIKELADEILNKFDTHKPLVEHKVRIDFLFAFASVDEQGEAHGCAITHHGVRAYGLTRKIPLKERAMGRGDAEVMLDGDWWQNATEASRRALLDHEMHHLEVCFDEDQVLITDDLKRPKLKLRKHDVEVGWFAIVAGRHGSASLEMQQAKVLMDSYGQLFWPALDMPKQLGDGEPVVMIGKRGMKRAKARK